MEVHPPKDRPLRTLLALYWPERGCLALATLFWFFKSSPYWVLPIITANIIDIVSNPQAHPPDGLWWNFAWGTLFVGQHALTHVWHYDALSLAVRRTETRLRTALSRHLQLLPIAYYRHMDTGRLQSKVLRDVENIGLATRDLYSSGLYGFCTAVVILVVTARRAPWFIPIFVVATPVFAWLYHRLRSRTREVNGRFQHEFERLSERFAAMLDMIPVTRAHAVEEHELALMTSRLAQVQHAGLRLDRQYGVVNSAAWVTFTQFSLAGLVLSAWLSYHRVLPLSPGDVVLMSAYIGALTTALVGFLTMLPTIARGLEGLRGVNETLNSAGVEENSGKRALAGVRGGFEFQDVRFAYPDQAPGEAALADLSLRVEPGETLGIVGASGSGKSTLIGLLLGFHRPVAGRLLLDGVDLATVNLSSYRQRIAVVGQETILFEGTVRENILYGVPHLDEARLQAAMADANAAEFIARLPHGLDTPLGVRGACLSGGQRQRIAIARALVRCPQVLILDEATSALDAEGEAVVQDALDRLMQGRTTFIVAHRLSTLRRVDRIAVLEAGRLVELGAPDDLLIRPDGLFTRLHAARGNGSRSTPEGWRHDRPADLVAERPRAVHHDASR